MIEVKKGGVVCLTSFLCGYLSTGCSTTVESSLPTDFKGMVFTIQDGKPMESVRQEIPKKLMNSWMVPSVASAAVSSSVPMIYEDDPQIQNYEVDGVSVRDISTSLDRKVDEQKRLGKRYRAFTNTFTNYSYRLICINNQACDAMNIDSCKVDGLRIRIRSQIILPKLRQDRNRCTYVNNVWEKFSSSILDHEQGHISTARSAAVLLVKQLTTLSSQKKFRSCNLLHSFIADLFDLEIARLKVMNIEYDLSNQHGNLTGVCFGPFCESYDKVQDDACSS